MTAASPSNHVIPGLLLSFVIAAMASSVDGWTGFVCALLVSGVVGLIWLARLFMAPRMGWSFCDLQGSALLSSYSIGPAITITFGDWDISQLNTPGQFEKLFTAYVFMIVSVGLLSIAAKIERPFWIDIIERIISEKSEINPIIFSFIIISLFTFINLFISDELIFRGSGEKTSNTTTVLLSSSLTMIFCWIAWSFDYRNTKNHLTIFVFLFIFIPIIYIYLIGEGRRLLFIHTFTFMLLIFWRANPQGLRALSILTIAGVIFVFGTMSFEAIRSLASQTMQIELSNVSAASYTNIASNALSENWSYIVQTQLLSLPDRVFLIKYLSDILSPEYPIEFGYGRETLAHIVLSFPSVLFPDKVAVIAALGGIAEARAFEAGAIEYRDFQDTALTIAAIELGMFGPVYVGLISLFIGLIMAAILRSITCPSFLLMYFSLIIVRFTMVESIFVSFSMITIFLFVFFWPIAQASGFLRGQSIPTAGNRALSP